MARHTGSTSSAAPAVSTSESAPNTHKIAATLSASSRACRAPRQRPTSTVPPAVRPMARPVIVCITWPPTATAHTAAASEKCPTINRSEAP